MKRLAISLAAFLLMALTFWPQAIAASTSMRINGGGTGTFGVDLDGDGDIDASQFALGITLQADGSAQGHFECLMAGRSQMDGPLMRFHLMAVEGPVTRGSLNRDGSVTLTGTGSVKMNNGKGPITLTGMPFTVKVKAGGPGTGTMDLTVPGVITLPTETVSTGQIVIH